MMAKDLRRTIPFSSSIDQHRRPDCATRHSAEPSRSSLEHTDAGYLLRPSVSSTPTHPSPPTRSPVRPQYGRLLGQPLPLYPRSPVWSESLLPPPAGSQSHSRMDVGSPGQSVFPGTWGGARAGQGPSRGRSSGEHAQRGGRRHAIVLNYAWVLANPPRPVLTGGRGDPSG